MAGRHRKSPRHRGRHRKPPSAAQIALPTGTGVAVVIAAVLVATHGNAHGTPPVPFAPSPILNLAPTDPPPSVLGFHTTRPAGGTQPTVHHRAPAHPAVTRHQAPAAFRVQATSACYLQVTSRGGKLLVRRILHRGDHLTFRHHGLHVVLGNAGGARISLDGHRSHVAGASGEVRLLRVR